MTVRLRDVVVALLALMLVATACGGGSDTDDQPVAADADATADDGAGDSPASTQDDSSSADAESDAADAAAGPVDGGDDDGAADDDAADDDGEIFEPGSVEFRAVNLLDEPVDVYVRTTGLVRAMQIAESFPPGAVSDFVAPPEGGSFIVTTAGAGDPTCVTQCDHFIAEVSAFIESYGPTRTVLLYDDEFSGPSASEYWEQPTEESFGFANAMIPAQTLSALATIVGVPLLDADFGLRVATSLSEGCLDSVNLPGALIGGTSTPTYAFDNATSFTLHDQSDAECAEAPVGGPFDFFGGPGTRSFLFLDGSPGDMTALQLPMSVGEVVDVATNDADRDLVLDLMADELVLGFALPDDQAQCAAEAIVDATGTEAIFADGTLQNLDTLPPEVADTAAAALINAVESCGIDPALLAAGG